MLTCRAPIDELDGPFGFDGGDGGVDVFRDDISSVQDAAGHVLAVSGVAFHQLVGRLETRVRYFRHRQLLVISLFRGDHRSVRH